jgi:exodeoxyribonuclease VII large subunit
MIDSLTVTDLSIYLRELLESSERLQDVWISGEVSNLTRAASGHWYYTLKDANAQIKAVMWRSAAAQQSYIPSNGDQVIAHGYVSYYDQRGDLQLYTDKLRPQGVGDLYAQFERLKAKLDSEGLFAAERKRPLPTMPHIIGVVTSADAAAFQDVQNVLRRRFPLAEVLLSPTPVQGSTAAPQIAAAIGRLQDTPIDVMIVCRGGGSIEDLWAFNDERVARAIVSSRVPVISGVGHETDFTIADFAADLRAPTPSAAAELATPNVDDMRANVIGLTADLTYAMEGLIERKRDDVREAARTLRQSSPLVAVRGYRQRVDDLTARLSSAERGRLTLLRERLNGRMAALNAADPRAPLAKGYALVTRSDDASPVTTKNVRPGDGVTITLHNGELKARIEDKDSHERYTRTLF